MATPHFVYAVQSDLETWVTPTRWVMAENADVQSEREQDMFRVTGVGRGLAFTVPGAKPVKGQLLLPWWVLNVNSIFTTFMRDTTTTAVASGVKDHALLHDDTLDLLGLSIQLQNSAAVARNVLGAVVGKATLAFATKQRCRLTFDMEAKDDALAGGNWDSLGTASASQIGTTDYADLMRPFMYYDIDVTIGGAAALDEGTGKLSISGGTTHKLLRKIEIGIDHGLDTDGYGLARDPTRQEIPPQARTVSVSMDRSWTDFDLQLAQAWRAGTALPIGIDIQGPPIDETYFYEAHIILPAFIPGSAKHPPLTGDHNTPIQTISGEATVDPDTGHDIGIWVRTSEATL